MSRAFYVGWAAASALLGWWQFTRGDGLGVALNYGIAAFAAWKAWEARDG